MSVIGRLDEGVEALLINPLRERQRRDAENREEPSPPRAPAVEKERDAAATPPPEARREDDDSLPVWLL